MTITALNGQEYDLDNLQPGEKRYLQSCGHLPKDSVAAVAIDTPSVSDDIEQTVIPSVSDDIEETIPTRKRK